MRLFTSLVSISLVKYIKHTKPIHNLRLMVHLGRNSINRCNLEAETCIKIIETRSGQVRLEQRLKTLTNTVALRYTLV